MIGRREMIAGTAALSVAVCIPASVQATEADLRLYLAYLIMEARMVRRDMERRGELPITEETDELHALRESLMAAPPESRCDRVLRAIGT